MNTEYIGLINEYNSNDIKLSKMGDSLFVNDKEYKIKWNYSEKKKKYFSKINYQSNIKRYDIIVFKNDYTLILSDNITIKEIDDIEFTEDLPF